MNENNAKHTPGPWTHRQAYTTGEPVEQVIQRGTEVLSSVHDLGNDRRDEHDANARLIAAAPELLEALETIADVPLKGEEGAGRGLDRHDASGFIRIARAAIAKATGERE